MCGIVGMVSSSQQVKEVLFEALTSLQHRGQNAAGVMTCEDHQVFLSKGNGLVRDVLTEKALTALHGRFGIGHVRYPTAGFFDHALEAQPFYVNFPYGLGLVHNGNLINARELSSFLKKTAKRHLNTASDSEVLLNVFAHELSQVGSHPSPLTADQLFQTVSRVFKQCQGAYSVVMLIAGVGLLAFRDPHGIRPLVYGTRTNEAGEREVLFASESVALDRLNFTFEGDVGAGEAIFVDCQGKIVRRVCTPNASLTPCLFEYVYFARPDSLLDGISVYQMRWHMGELLAEKILREWGEELIDIVVPVPDTSTVIALPLAQRLGVPYQYGLIKNHYVGRTFIMPGQAKRCHSVKQKLSAVESVLKGKNVLLVDDSIVRGTTSKEIIQLVREKGAKKVYFASAAPPVRHPNVYGIDMPSYEELIAAKQSIEAVTQWLRADRLIYQDLSDLHVAAKRAGGQLPRFEESVFTGKYLVGNITPEWLEQWAEKR